ncbi:MAG: glycine--tRNA ligase subunit beta [bacterium]
MTRPNEISTTPENESSRATDAISASAPFLLEIGSEEIPARFIPSAMMQLQRRCEELFTTEGLTWSGLRLLATPRRLAILCDELACQQPDRITEVTGPPLKVAYDEQGRPTPAGFGFARKNGVDLADCFTVTEPRGEYLAVRKHIAGQPTTDILAAKLPGVVLGLSFPKVMRWGESDLEYARPLQWLVVLLGDELVPVQVGDLHSGRETRGHRTLAENRSAAVSAPTAYIDLLRDLGVMVDPEERRERIKAGIAANLADLPTNATWVEDEELLTEVVFLCEFPTPFTGGYEESFFEVPAEVIVTALKAHQRYFAVARPDGSGLLPYFLAVRDGGEQALDSVRRGNERVLRARLADALFYWKFDQQRNPDEHTAQLGSVTWLEGYGSLLDKTQRLRQLVDQLWRHGLGGGTALPPDAARAATICKSDQVSEMIKDGKEFTRLEGIIGAHYARQSGESEAVCRAIERHYLPRAAGGELPGDAISSVLAAADRLDTLAGCWLAGFVPTGAKDPYALRRHALALLRIVLDREARIALDHWLSLAVSQFSDTGDTPLTADATEKALCELKAFILTRFTGYLVDNLDCVPEIVRAILPVHGNDPTDALAWVRALTGFRNREDFLLLATGFKRCKNILEGETLSGEALISVLERWEQGGQAVNGDTFRALKEPAEVDLRQLIETAAAKLVAMEACGDYVGIFETLSRLGPAIDTFFDTVRVNVDDADLRQSRHDYLREVHGLFARYADFSEVAPAE